MEIKIINGTLSSDHIHVFVEIPPKIAVSDFVQKAKGCSSERYNKNFQKLEKSIMASIFWQEAFLVVQVVMLLTK